MAQLTVQDIMRAQQSRPGGTAGSFQWKQEYIPFVIAGIGVALIPVFVKMARKRRKRK